MTTIQRAREVLAGAEGALRKLMEEDLHNHQYGDLAEMARLADGLSRLLGGGSAAQPTSSQAPASQPAPRKAPSPKRPTGTADKPAYPRFERDGDKLIKVGWSKKHKDQYEHRAPRDSVIAVTRRLTGSVKPGQVFEVEDILPVSDSSSGEIPAYQVYLTLGWLRHAGTIEKKGRDGYVLRDDSLANGGVDRLWEEVPVRAA